MILAHSPQAKGRVERLWNTFQDRLVSELRLAKAKTMEQAQVVLERYIAVHNRKFSKPAKAEPAWRKVSALEIERALCFNNSVRWPRTTRLLSKGRFCRSPGLRPRSYANRRIDVHVLLDGAVEFFYKTEKIAAFDSKTTHTIGLYLTHGNKEGFRYGPVSLLQSQRDSVP